MSEGRGGVIGFSQLRNLLIRGTGVVSVTLNFHPQGRNVNDVWEKLKSRRPGGHCGNIIYLGGESSE